MHDAVASIAQPSATGIARRPTELIGTVELGEETVQDDRPTGPTTAEC